MPLAGYFSIEISSRAFRHAVKPPRRLATSRPDDSRMLAARLERIPPPHYVTIREPNATVAPTRTANESLATTFSAPGRCPAPKTCGGRGSIRTMFGSISRTNGRRARDAADAPLVLIARTLG